MFTIKNIHVAKDFSGKYDLLVVGAQDGENKVPAKSSFSALSNQSMQLTLKSEKKFGSDKKRVVIYNDGSIKKISFYGYKEGSSPDETRCLGSEITSYANLNKVKNIAIDAKSFSVSSKNLQAFVEGLVLGSYEFLDYKPKSRGHLLTRVTLIGDIDKKILLKAQILARGVCYGRDLSNHPANVLTPTYIARDAIKIAKSNKKMTSKVIDVSKFQKMGLGSFYGVAMGAHEPAKLIIVEYRGGGAKDRPIALVGKGVTFDSGGISIKPSSKMDEMKFDMCGSAVVMGALKVVAELKPKVNIVFAIGATENMPGGKAQRPGDIVTAYNGKTIEVLNTDAEGRLILADVLAYVTKNYKPREILDFATLTGAVLVAIGDRASGLMGNNPKLISKVKKASDKSGERVWELPMWKEYSKDIESKVADIRNLGRPPLAGSIAGGVFLQEFVGETPWCHLDIAGTAWGPKEPSYLPRVGATGVGIRLVYDFIEDSLN
jgi:leucyl aminopeptidase